MKKTKIIATIGPKTNSVSMLKKMVNAGMNIVRINLSHSTNTFYASVLENVKKVRNELKVNLPILLDTRGPELRVKTFKNGSAKIVKGQEFIFTTKDLIGSEHMVSVNMPKVLSELEVGQKILTCNGLLNFRVTKIEDGNVFTKALNSGVIANQKSMSIPNLKFNTPYLNELDKTDLLWAIKNKIEFVAASFVNSIEDVNELREFIKTHNGTMKIISKIESKLGVKNLDEIIEASDGIMVARGDLGVEVNISKVPQIQKTIIRKSRENGKAVITATEMLESMIDSPRPTRAEISDIANAIYDGTSAVMLSGETASGNYPVEAVKTMAEACLATEKNLEIDFSDLANRKCNSTTEIIAKSAVETASISNAKVIVVFTNTGLTASLISKYRPDVDLLAICNNEKVKLETSILYGVMSVLGKKYVSTDEMFDVVKQFVLKLNLAKKGDYVVVVCGEINKTGGTNLLKLLKV